MNVYTYFDPTISASESQAPLIQVWEETWRRHGWTPRVLTPRNARANPKSRAAATAAKKLGLHESRLFRLIASEGVGGGWLVDYDVMNFGFKPTVIRPRVWCGETDNPLSVLGSQQQGIGTLVDSVLRGSNFTAALNPFFKSPHVLICLRHAEDGWQNTPLVRFWGAGKLDAIRGCSRC